MGELGTEHGAPRSRRTRPSSWRRAASRSSRRPAISPAYIGVGYIIGPVLASLNFSGGVLAWGLLVPLLIYFLGPQLNAFLPAGAEAHSWDGLAIAVWRFIVRPIAVGGMLVGAAYTLFRMRKNLIGGLGDRPSRNCAAARPPPNP